MSAHPDRKAWALAAAVVSGLLMFAAFPPLQWTALAFVAWVPLILAQHLAGPAGRAARRLGGLTVGTLFALLALSVDPPEVITGAAWVGIALALGMAGGLLAALLALPGQTPALHTRLRGWGFVWLPALSWTGIEYLRLITTAGHQWGMTATTQIDVAPLRAYLPLAGMWPVTAITIATNYAIAAGVLLLLGRGAYPRRALGAGIVSVAAVWLLGLALATLPGPDSAVVLGVAAVQPGEHVPDHPLTRPLIERASYLELTDTITDLHAPLTAQASAAGAGLVVWPEAVGWVDPFVTAYAPQVARVSELARRTGTTIVWSYFIRVDADRTRNEMLLVRPDGSITAPTTKDHPVWVIGERSMTAGLHPVYEVDGVRIGLAAGPDGTYTDTIARLARGGAQLVAVSTHDWLAYTSTQLLHLRLRAAEQRVAIVRADWRYGSAIIAPDGSLLRATPQTARLVAVISASVPVVDAGTPYRAMGDWLGVAALIVAVLGSAAAALHGNLARRRKAPA